MAPDPTRPVATYFTRFFKWGALGALALLLIFSVAISLNLLRGHKPDCRCFGQVTAGPIGWPTIVRNILLVALAAMVFARGPGISGMEVLSWLSATPTLSTLSLLLGVAVLVLVAVEGWLLVQLIAQNGRLLLRLDVLEDRLATYAEARQGAESPTGLPTAGISIGSSAPAFSLPGLYGEKLTLDAVRAAGKPVILLFVDPGCGPCTALLPEAGRWQRDHSAHLTLVLISRGTVESNRKKGSEHGLALILLQNDREVADAYRAHGTPSAVVVRPDGTIGSPLAQGVDAIRRLVDQWVTEAPWVPILGDANTDRLNGHPQQRHPRHAPPALSDGVTVGQTAPPVQLPDLNGRLVNLADFRGNTTMLLFWNPECGFCQQMLGDLRDWEANRPPEAPKLLVISSPPIEANRALGLQSTILLDEGFTTGREFGAHGTPSAVLVDPEGRVMSAVAVGAQKALALARTQSRPPEPTFA